RSPSRNRYWSSAARDSSRASDAIAIRRSPGARTPSHSRRTPDEPPSSATVTTAVTSPVICRTAERAADKPWPPPMQTIRGSGMRRSGLPLAAVDVAMLDGDGQSAAAEHPGDLVADHDGPMAAAGTPDRDGEVALSFGQVAGDEHLEHLVEAIEEVLRRLPGHDVFAHT